MTKILNILNGIKINKDNVELPYTKIRKSTQENSSITFTRPTKVNENGTVIILIDNNMKPELALVTIHGEITNCIMLTGKSTISASGNSVTININPWSVATLIDFAENKWS